MKTIEKLMILCILGICLSGCGDSGGKDDEAVVVDPVVTPAFTLSKASDLQTPFYCYGGSVSFAITHTGTCSYSFDIINKDTQNILLNLATGVGNLDVTLKLSLAKGDYFLSANTLCAWSITGYGRMVQYGSYVLCNNSPDIPPTSTCENNGGVLGCDRISGYFICKDGSKSTAVCICP